MKRLLLVSALLLALTAPCGAQSLSDAYRFGGVDYTGTARMIGLGGAMGAIGCDLGSITINPAGSAVAGYSQFTITPNLSIATSKSSYALSPDEAYGKATGRSKTSFTLPNIGLSARYDAENDGALTSFTLAFVMNGTQDYREVSGGSGINNLTSKFAEMANAATGISTDVLGSSSFYYNGDYTNYWDTAMGYDIGLINSYGTSGSDYVGCTEVLNDQGVHYVPDNLIQKSRRTILGTKNDILMNMAFNFRDRLYVGLNMGLPVVSYSSTEAFSEVAQNPDMFPVTFNYSNGTQQSTTFNNALYQYNYTASAVGVYLKLGAIWLPFSGLRLGVAYQTPTSYDVSETWVHSGKVGYSNGDTYSGCGEQGNYEYTYVAPQMADFSLAWTFGRIGLISVDYTIADYHHIHYSEISYDDDYGYDDSADDVFDYTNTAMKVFSGVSHNVRAGVELNLSSDFCLRGGFSLRTSPEKYYTVDDAEFGFEDYNEDYYYGRKTLPGNAKYYKENTTSFSAGFGYNPAGSFFADFAVRYTKYPDSIYRPYYDYDGFQAPSILISRGLWNAALTIGLRF